MDVLTFPWPVLAAPLVGSFLATLAVRLTEGRPFVGGRSACPACGAALSWFELVPLASWTLQHGRCRSCRAPIAALYPLTEAGALALAAWAWAVRPGPDAWLDAAMGWIVLTLAACDIRARVLPDSLVLGLGVGGLLVALPVGLPDHAIGAAAGFAALYGVRALHKAVRGVEGLGLGDVKLAGAAGAWVGWQGLPSLVALAAGAGLIAAGLLILLGHRVDRGTEIPFGPFLALGLWMTWLYGSLWSSI
jgi:leader peptidase (prepilin peptidase)/N-methyltransferase